MKKVLLFVFLTPAIVAAQTDNTSNVKASPGGDVGTKTTAAFTLRSVKGTYGAIGDGVADDTAAFQAAASSGKSINVPQGNYKLTSTVTLAANTNFYCLDNLGSSTVITGNFAGFLFTWNGTGGHEFRGCGLSNPYAASAQTAGIFNLQGITGPDKFENLTMTFGDTGIKAANAVSTVIVDSYLACTGAAAFSTAWYGNGWNSGFRGGRAYHCNLAYDLQGGESWHFENVNAEFNNIVFRQQSISNLTGGGALETFGLLWTNAQKLPTQTHNVKTPWTDNGGVGVGWGGSVSFLNNLINPTANGASFGIGAPLFVVHGSGGFSGKLTLMNTILYGGGNPTKFLTVSGNFDYTVAAALISGMVVTNFDEAITIPTVPVDSYTRWVDYSQGVKILGAKAVSNARFCGTTTTCANTSNGTYRQFFGAVQLKGGTATVSGISPAFTAANTYICTATDTTTNAAVKVATVSGSSFSLTGTGTDWVGYSCIGN